MYLRWKRRLLSGGTDATLRAVLVRSVWLHGQARQQLIGYVGSIRERYLDAPAHRLMFWLQVEHRLARLAVDPQTRQRIEQRLACRVPRPTATDLHHLTVQQQHLTQLAATLPPGAPGAAGFGAPGTPDTNAALPHNPLEHRGFLA